MARLIFDLETTALPDITKIHCLAIKDTDTGDVYRFRQNDQENTIEYGVVLLSQADLIIGHNIIKFDIPVLQKFYPWFKPRKIFDTICGTRLVYTDLKDRDFRLARKTRFPKNLIGRHSLEAWGYRLMNYKGDFKGPWDLWTQEMDDYCLQDIEVTNTLFQKLMESGFSEESFDLEMDVTTIIYRQELHGFLFNQDAAAKLYADLKAKQDNLKDQLCSIFPDFEQRTDFIPKVNNKKRGYVKGVPTVKVKVIPFNPGSRQHIGKALIEKYNWKPNQFGEDGFPTVDEEILDKMKYPEAKLFSEYLMLEKRIGQISEGKQAWMKLVQKDGRIHGRIDTNGAVTGRMTHKNPNIAQVPKVGTPYGAECRALFIVAPGKVLVGIDASGLEARCLAHYMGHWDQGAYTELVLHGDIHTANQQAAGIDTRDNAKTFFYAFIYGAGDGKLGTFFKAGPKKGKEVREKFLNGLPALKALVNGVKAKARNSGTLRGLDGRLLRVRSEHSALNTLLQGAGAILMKKALVILDHDLQLAGLVPGRDYEFCANVHDEWQIETDPDKAEFIGQTAVTAITKAGEHFQFRCPLTGEYKIGGNWAETH